MSDEARPPLGSWARLYVLVVVIAVAIMMALYWFTARWNIPLSAS
ncbi:MAG: hypothetical protein AAF628_27975 [Planctomycetota bacterium]